MSCLKTVWKEGQNCSNSNRCISGTNWNFCMRFMWYDPWTNVVKTGLIHTPGPEIPDLAYHIHSLLTLLTQLLTLLRHMILQWFQPKWLSMDICIHGKTILLILLRLLTCHYIKLSKVSNLSRGQNSCMNMPSHKHTSNIDIIWVYT